jgi:hypothetical protein
MSRELIFKIDAWTPETLPMERLGQYLVELARLYGEPARVPFRKLRKGSAILVSDIDEPAIPKVEKRLALARGPQAPQDIVQPFRRIDQMLADDNAVGVVRFPKGGVIVAFPGRDRPKPIDYGAVREEGFIEGELVRIGGRDLTVHLQLQDGDTLYTNIVTNRETARELGSLIFGPTVRLHGTGTWRRSEDNGWWLESFKVARFDVLDGRDLTDTVAALRSIGGSRWHEEDDPVATLLQSRHGGSDRKRSST